MSDYDDEDVDGYDCDLVAQCTGCGEIATECGASLMAVPHRGCPNGGTWYEKDEETPK